MAGKRRGERARGQEGFRVQGFHASIPKPTKLLCLGFRFDACLIPPPGTLPALQLGRLGGQVREEGFRDQASYLLRHSRTPPPPQFKGVEGRRVARSVGGRAGV